MFRTPVLSRTIGSLIPLLLLIPSTPLAGGERETSYVYPPFKHTLGMSRIGGVELKLFLGPTSRFDNPQGLAVIKLKSRDDPRTDRDDDELSLFLVNSGRGEIIYNPSLYSLKKYGRRGTGVGEFLDPRGIQADSFGNVVVADTGNRRLVLLKLGADELEWQGTMADTLEVFCPTDVDLAGGLIWATDFAGHRIVRFDMSGGFLGQLPLTAEGGEPLDGPLALEVARGDDPWNRSRRFSLVVVDRQGTRVQVFDQDFKLRASRMSTDLLDTPARFGYPVIDLHGQVLLPDSLGQRVLKLDSQLNLLTVFDHIDDDDTPLQFPNSLAIHRRFGQLFVVEKNGGSYAWTGTDIHDLKVVDWRHRRKSSVRVEYSLTEPSLLTFLVADTEGERELSRDLRRGAGPHREWVSVPDTMLAGSELVVRGKPTYSASKKLTVERRIRLNKPSEGEQP